MEVPPVRVDVSLVRVEVPPVRVDVSLVRVEVLLVRGADSRFMVVVRPSVSVVRMVVRVVPLLFTRVLTVVLGSRL